MTEQEIEQYAKEQWDKMYSQHLQKDVPIEWWEHYIQGMKDAAKVLVQQGYTEKLLEWMNECGWSAQPPIWETTAGYDGHDEHTVQCTTKELIEMYATQQKEQ